MSWLQTLLSEIYGLFVDDAGQAIFILSWLGLMWLVLHRFGGIPAWAAGGLLFAGLAAILFESVLRFARKSNSR